MELPRRSRGDELLPAGALLSLRNRLRRNAHQHDLTTVIACAFDRRTRMLPFFYADQRMSPAGVRAIGSALVDAGFAKTRVVHQQWNPNFRPAQMRLDGRTPDLFLVSSMQIHTAPCHALIRDACRIAAADRPLIIAGGPKAIYEPWDHFSVDPRDPWAADVVVTGEEYVLLSLLEVLLSIRATGEPLRGAFLRARHGGLDDIPGLVYAREGGHGAPAELVDTGPQQLLGDLDELPHPTLGYQLLEPPSRQPTLGSRALPARLVRKYSPISSIVLTFGCRFVCPYCPIPGYNQRQYRVKSGARIADELVRLRGEYGLRVFFGADDNFFNQPRRTMEIVETLARTEIDGVPLRKRLRLGTEVTVHDTLRMKDHLATVRRAGIRALWLGVEDMTASLVNKGQTVDNTTAAFRLLQEHGIAPMPMMMHHDAQPLYTRTGPGGLLNQAHMLRRAGAISLQVLMLTPSPGSKQYEESFTSGLVYDRVDGRRVEHHMLDGNYVVASKHEQPWKKQFNIMLAYLFFYNPLRFLIALVHPKSKMYFADALWQAVGMWGLTHTVRRTLGWAIRLIRGGAKHRTTAPASPIPVRRVGVQPPGHAIAATSRIPTPGPEAAATAVRPSCERLHTRASETRA